MFSDTKESIRMLLDIEPGIPAHPVQSPEGAMLYKTPNAGHIRH